MPPEQRRMSMIFQSYAVWPHMTVFDNVAFGLQCRKLTSSDIRQRVDRMLDIVHLRHLAERYPSELSGGQQQRVALARALANEPETLLLDEPLSNLDANLREEMRFEIRRLHDEFGITSVYVTHDQGEAMVTADRVVVMNAGRDGAGRSAGGYLRSSGHALRRELHRHEQSASIARLHLARRLLRTRPLSVATEMQDRSNAPCVLAIRPHEIELFLQDAKPSDVTNFCRVPSRRQSFLGDARDYLDRSRQWTECPRVISSRNCAQPWVTTVWLRLPRRASASFSNSA